MRQDSIEFGWSRAAKRERQTAPIAVGDRIDAGMIAHAPPCAVIDAAFAGFEKFERASTTEAATTTNGGPRLMTKSLVANLAAQLEALDCQRERLAELLRSIDGASFANQRNSCSDVARQSV
jgi:hypothetical protein